MEQKEIRNIAQTGARLSVAETDRLASGIAGSHHQRAKVRSLSRQQLRMKKKMMQRGIGQHDPDGVSVRSQNVRQRAGTTGADHYGTGRRTESLPGRAVEKSQLFRLFQRGGHDRKSLVRPVLTFAQTLHGFFTEGVAYQMKAAYALCHSHKSLL